VERDAGKKARDGSGQVRVDWMYVGGFFDGEGGVSVAARAWSNTLALKVTMGQKSQGILKKIQAFLLTQGIHSVIYRPKTGVSTLEIGRVDDLTRYLSSVPSIIKRKQVDCALQYLREEMPGNTLIKVFDEEHMKLRRKSTPIKGLGMRFPLTKLEAVALANELSQKSRQAANREIYTARLRRRASSLPPVFGVKDVETTFGVSKGRAQRLARLMEKEGLVACTYEKVPPRFHRLKCERLF